MEYLISLSNAKNISEYKKLNINSFLVGIKHLSIYQNKYYDIDEIKKLLNENINLFVSVNKLMHNKDLKHLEETLIELSKLNVKGVLYDDLAVLNITKRLDLDLNLIFASSHLVTNYHTINILDDKVKGALLSSEITLEEMINIKENTNKTIIAPFFGYQIMTSSKRKFIKNYMDYFNKENKSKMFYMEDKFGKYPLFEDENGTHILTKDILNAKEDKERLDIMDYLYLSDLNIEEDKFIEVLKDLNNINNLFENSSNLFMHKESYFKVIR